MRIGYKLCMKCSLRGPLYVSILDLFKQATVRFIFHLSPMQDLKNTTCEVTTAGL